MMKRVCIVLAVLAVATAFPADEYTPEADTDLLLQATARVHSLMAEGKDDSACRNLAKSEQKAIEDDVKAQQQMLDGLPTGKTCPDAGQDGVKKAKKAKTEADNALVNAKKAASNAAGAKIDFGKRSFSSISASGSCAISKQDSKYVAAKKDVDATQKAKSKAEGAAKSAASALVDAEKAAKKEKLACECNVQEKQAAAWKTASKKNSNAESYAKATNMLCVLDGKTTCPAKTCPSVKKPTIHNGSKQAQCGKKPDQYYYQIKAKHGQCLDANQRNKSGAKVHMWTCQPKNKNQMWEYDGHNNGRIKATHGLCLDAPQRNTKGGKLTVSNCGSNNKNQMWEKKGSQIKNKHGICIDAGGKNERSKNGGKCHMWSCSTSNDNQKWQLIRKTKKA